MPRHFFFVVTWIAVNFFFSFFFFFAARGFQERLAKVSSPVKIDSDLANSAMFKRFDT